METRSYYGILTVPATATTEEIKLAYKKLAIQYHPDKNAGDEKKAEEFKKIAEAYEVLSDSNKRQSYDQKMCVHHPGQSRVVNPSPFFSMPDIPSFTVCLPTHAILTNSPIDPDNIKVVLLGSNSAGITKFLRFVEGSEGNVSTTGIQPVKILSPSSNLIFVIDFLKEQYSMNILPASCLNDASIIFIFNQQGSYLPKIKACMKNNTDACQVFGLNYRTSICHITDRGSLADYQSHGSSSTEQHEKVASQCISQLFTALESKLIERIPKEVMEERYVGIKANKSVTIEKSDKEEFGVKSCFI